MKLKLFVILISVCLPAVARAQKAYEMAHYKTSLQGKAIKLNLANGYIGASQVSMITQAGKKPVIFLPASNAAQAPFILRNTDNNHADYFILNNMQEVYDHLPPYISGRYYNGKQIVPVKFYRTK